MSQINEMTKKELIAHMRASKEINHPSRDTASWKRAFELYKSMTGNDADMECSGCWKRVHQWLNK